MRKFALFYSVFFLLISPIFAKNTQNQQQEQVQNPGKEDKMQERVQDRIQARCDKAQELVNKKLRVFNQNKERHAERFGFVLGRLNTIATDLEKKGYDVSKFSQDIKTFGDMVEDYDSVYAEFIDLLENSQTSACGESDGDFKMAVQRAREKHKLAIQKRQEIREFYVEVLREDIKDLREQAQNLESEE